MQTVDRPDKPGIWQRGEEIFSIYQGQHLRGYQLSGSVNDYSVDSLPTGNWQPLVPALRSQTVSQNTQALIDQLRARDAKGLQKYGISLDRDDMTAAQWLQHLQEELLDGAAYVEGLKKKHSGLVPALTNGEARESLFDWLEEHHCGTKQATEIADKDAEVFGRVEQADTELTDDQVQTALDDAGIDMEPAKRRLREMIDKAKERRSAIAETQLAKIQSWAAGVREYLEFAVKTYKEPFNGAGLWLSLCPVNNDDGNDYVIPRGGGHSREQIEEFAADLQEGIAMAQGELKEQTLAALQAIDREASQRMPFWEDDYSPDFHVELTLTVAELRAIRAGLQSLFA